MKTVTISSARSFSLDAVQTQPLVFTDDLQVELLCFEAGQSHDEANFEGSCLYQVLEGEALVRRKGESERLGKGKILTVPGGTAHVLENAGGGLLVVMSTRAR